jgi:hypothetical protein
MSAVPIDCPNHDDICVVGPLDAPICMFRHEVRSRMCSRIHISLTFVSTLLVSDHVCFRFLANERPFKSYQESQFIILYSFSLMTPIPKMAHGVTTAPPLRAVTCPAWTCSELFYGPKDGCDCNCGAWDPDCDATTGVAQKVFNCDTN